MISTHKIIVAAIVPAVMVAPEPLRSVIVENPLRYAGLSVLFALFGGFAVQHREWIYGRVTTAQAFSELMFSAMAGFVAYWLAVRQQLDYLDLFVAALLLGMTGRPMLFGAKKMLVAGLLQQLIRALGGVNDSPKDTTLASEDRPRGSNGGICDRDGGAGQSRPGDPGQQE